MCAYMCVCVSGNGSAISSAGRDVLYTAWLRRLLRTNLGQSAVPEVVNSRLLACSRRGTSGLWYLRVVEKASSIAAYSQ